MSEFIPEPVLLNCWKHHLPFIIERIRAYRGPQQLENLKKNLPNIGNSITDIYTGEIKPAEVARIAISIMRKGKHFSYNNYLQWIQQSKGRYRSQKFYDGSVWIFRIGEDRVRYIHIHPGRNTPFAFRVKATILKTAICTMIESKINHRKPESSDCINYVRQNYLNMAPFKTIKPESELMKLIGLMRSEI